MNWGSPGAGKPHAGKYRELTRSRQRGGGGQVIPLTSALPTQTVGFWVTPPPSGDGGYIEYWPWFGQESG